MNETQARQQSAVMDLVDRVGGLWRAIALVLVASLVLAVGASLMREPHAATAVTASSAGASGSTVLYQVDGSAEGVDITYETPSGVGQQSGRDVPLVTTGSTMGMSFSGFRSGDFLYISAQRRDDLGGGADIRCSIKVNGRVISTNMASGGASIATCQGTMPR